MRRGLHHENRRIRANHGTSKPRNDNRPKKQHCNNVQQFDLHGVKPTLEMCHEEDQSTFHRCLTVESCLLLNSWWRELQRLQFRNCFADLRWIDDVCSDILSFLPAESLCSMRLVSTQFCSIIENYNLLDCYSHYIWQKLMEDMESGKLYSLLWILTRYPHLKSMAKIDSVIDLVYYELRGAMSEPHKVHELVDEFVQLCPDWFDELVRKYCKSEYPVPSHLINHKYFDSRHSLMIWTSFKTIHTVCRYSIEDINEIMSSSFVQGLNEFKFIADQMHLNERFSSREQFSVIVKHILRKSNHPTRRLITSLGLMKSNIACMEHILEWVMKDECMRNKLKMQIFLEEASYELNLPVVKLLIDKRWADPTKDDYRCFKLSVRDSHNLWACLLTHPSASSITKENDSFYTPHLGYLSLKELNQKNRDVIAERLCHNL